MPKIQQYTAQVTPQGGNANLSTPDAFGVRTSGAALEQFTDFLEKKAERDDFFSVQKDMAKVRGDWLTRLNELEQNAPAGAPDFTKNVMNEYRTAMKEMLSSRSMSRENMDRLLLEQEQTGTMLLQRAMTFEAQARGQKRRLDARAYSADVSRNVFLYPFMFADENKKLPEAFNALGLQGNALEEALRDTRADMAENAIKGMIKNGGDLTAARNALAEGPISKYVSGDLAAKLTNAIETEQRHREQEARQKAALAKAAAFADIQVTKADVEAEIDATGRSANKDRLVSALRVAYSDKPQVAQQLIDQLSLRETFYTSRVAVSANTPEQDETLLADLRNKASGPNASMKLAQLQATEVAVRQKREQLNKDGFSYVVQTNPEIRAKLQAAANDPKEFRSVLALIDQKQADLGVQPWRRTYLGTQQAASLAAQINAQATTNPEQAANRLETLATQYGPLWANAINELEGGGLNTTFVVAARLTNPDKDALTRRDLVTAVTAAQDTKAAVRPDDLKTLNEALNKLYQPFERPLTSQGAAGARTLIRETDAARSLALLYMTRDQISPQEAARKATDNLIMNRYDMQKTFFAPKGLGNKAQTLAEQTVRNLKLEDMPLPAGGDRNLTEDARRRAALSFAQRGTWVNTPEGNGIQLLDPNRSPVRLRDGRHVVLMFDALPEIERATPGTGGGVMP